MRLVRRNGATAFGKQHRFDRINTWADFGRVPISDYEVYREPIERIRDGEANVLTAEPVEILQPTSGTACAPKLIPHTRALSREFAAALDAWVFDLFMQRPRLLLGRHYWSISPATAPPEGARGKVPVGFLDDAAYLGPGRRLIMGATMAVPAEVRLIADIEANQYVTLLFLIRLKNLRLISVWHPSFLTILLGKMRRLWPRCLHDLAHGGIDPAVSVPAAVRRRLSRRLGPMPRRARELGALDPGADDLFRRVWPRLQVISCWREGHAGGDVSELEHGFPGILIQGKGLLATEGVVSIPFGRSQRHVCAVTSHVLEFQDDAGAVFPLWSLCAGKTYRVLLTTGAGLYRYQLMDRVEVTGFHGQAPYVRFLGRAGVVSDCVGEKLHGEHVEKAIADIARQYFGYSRFSLLAPWRSDGRVTHYHLLITRDDEPDPDTPAIAATLEDSLCHNHNYRYARRLGQIGPVSVGMMAADAKERYRRFMVGQGAIAGTVKFPVLCTVPGLVACLTQEPDTTHPGMDAV